MTGSRICVAGVGAVGGAVAGMLAIAGENVHLIARGNRLEQLRRDGLQVMRSGADTIRLRLPVSERAEFGVQDVLILAVKAYALPQLVPGLAGLIGSRTIVLPLVNGIPWWYFQDSTKRDGGRVSTVDPDGILHRFLRPDQVIGSVAFITSRVMDTGVVSVSGAPRLQIGEVAGDAHPRTHALAALLCAAGVPTTVSDRIRNELWTKVALNLATNPLSVVSGATLLEQFTDPRLLPITTAIIEETRRVAQAYGAAATMSLDEMIATGRRAGDFQTSMLQDYLAGRQLELGAIGVAVLELAAKVDKAMPVTQLIVDLAAHRGDARQNRAVPP